jgi:hypothetical protein
VEDSTNVTRAIQQTPTPLFSCRHGEREILASGGRRLLGKDHESYHSYYAIWETSLRV